MHEMNTDAWAATNLTLPLSTCLVAHIIAADPNCELILSCLPSVSCCIALCILIYVCLSVCLCMCLCVVGLGLYALIEDEPELQSTVGNCYRIVFGQDNGNATT